MDSVTVNTKEELSQAKNSNASEIVVIGELANKLKRAQKVTLLSAGTLAVITALLGTATITAPVTGGMSYFVAAPAAALSGLEIATIIVAASLGISLIIALFKGYEEIEYSKERLVLRRRKPKA
ncbi:hypothetical protein [Methylomicrobium agile]|uniref:hypothetical protein n=1 Tax=Methylomicrobium agile TaxID=39774 RepID=UPI0004DEE06F|nr:hypothetical protein [Methylomicrobium agile]